MRFSKKIESKKKQCTSNQRETSDGNDNDVKPQKRPSVEQDAEKAINFLTQDGGDDDNDDAITFTCSGATAFPDTRSGRNWNDDLALNLRDHLRVAVGTIFSCMSDTGAVERGLF